MKPYKLEFSRHEMMTDSKATGEMKKILQRKVRRQLNKLAQKEIEDEQVRPQSDDQKAKVVGRKGPKSRNGSKPKAKG